MGINRWRCRKVLRPLWVVEYFFNFENTNWHQYIIGYLLQIDDNNKIFKNDEYEGIEELDDNICNKCVGK